ncbi:BamA/TamA family outer membrane protein [Vibrio sp. WXL210]|uniref:BamA/TamA family outer membrane protein n=1 Tax=Vibrio sp. WXL210 TaxID=3450709 RepID=UPI003EC79FBB
MNLPFTPNCLCSLVLFTSLSSYAAPVKPLFETPEFMQDNFVDEVFDLFGADADYDQDKAIDLSYLPTLYYTPEQKFSAGVLLVGLYHTDSSDKAAQPSSLVTNLYFSSNQSYGIWVENMTQFNQGKQRLMVDLELHREASVFYGQGIDAGNRDDNKHEFREVLYTLKPTWLSEFGANYFLGVGADVTYARAEDIDNVSGNADPSQDYRLPSGTSAGLVLSSVYDSRDYRLNPSQGWLFQLDAGLYQNFDSSKSYTRYDLELANYINLNPAPGVLAWQVRGQFTDGDVPWYALADIGGSSVMRGYIKGRYRDNHMLMSQAEYRLPVVQRYGMVFWGAAGTLAPEVNELADEMLTSYGTGLRFRFKDRVNLRADIGFGKNETTFYINVNEVF